MKRSPKAPFDFNNLFVLEMANNHQGSVEHGLKIIDAMGTIVRKHSVRATVKLQFRDIDTFIHPADKKGSTNKHVPRFLSTKMSKKQFKQLVDATKDAGMLSMATPFDEASVDTIEELDVDIIKIASASAMDWPLLEKAVTLDKPMVVSVGGMSLPQIDRLVSFLEHRHKNFAIMHCVAIYPTPASKLHLRQIETLKKSYPNITIGFSTHEDPNNMSAIQIAYAKGARVFERHVGVPTDTITLNAYSSNPEQVSKWISAWEEARATEGETEWEHDVKEEEDLAAQRRGVFAKKPIKKGQKIKRTDVYFAFPFRHGQLASGEFKEGVTVADRAYKKDEALVRESRDFSPTIRDKVYHPIHEIKAMLNVARLTAPHEFTLELLHPYGIDELRAWGMFAINCIERAYRKRLCVLLPHQEMPLHRHTKEERTYSVLYGTLEIEADKRRKTLRAGDSLTVQNGVMARFWSERGSIFEEVSSVRDGNELVYADVSIKKVPLKERLTRMVNWGRNHFD